MTVSLVHTKSRGAGGAGPRLLKPGLVKMVATVSAVLTVVSWFLRHTDVGGKLLRR
jgi:hypothetical protein